MAPDGALYLGIDSSTQSLSAVVLEASGGRHRVVCELSLPFDQTLRHYGTRHGVLPNADPAIAHSSPVMWVEALDLLFARLAEQKLNLDRLAAISGSAQQHGSVYLNDAAARGLESLGRDASGRHCLCGWAARQNQAHVARWRGGRCE